MSASPLLPIIREGEVALSLRTVVNGQLRTVDYVLAGVGLIGPEQAGQRLAERCGQLVHVMLVEMNHA